jgi:HSP90 family molecular chaperone
LIQNAEDNNYSRAEALGVEPYIKFTIRPDTISIDCNEDGFTPENVRAICRIGESTKIRANAQYYIGEKGIGFKSVFMVASKVHIQSGPFSFSFEHEPGNNGMGNDHSNMGTL